MANKLKSLIQQADVYRTQGLLNEAQENLNMVIDIIEKSDKIQDKDKLLNAVRKKIAQLNKDFNDVGDAPTAPEIPDHVNELIKKLFSFSKDEDDKDAAALEGAIALAKFGQLETALAEFKKLLSVETTRVAAAKNVLRCHLELNNPQNAVDQFKTWQSEDLFTAEQLDKIRQFFDDILDKKGITTDLAPPEPESEEIIERFQEDSGGSADDEEFLDISAVAITFDTGPRKGEQVELDVSFQSGNIISLIISSKDQELIENLKVGVRLDDVHYYSPIAIFRGSGIVSAKTKIESGPKKGDYSLDIKIESI